MRNFINTQKDLDLFAKQLLNIGEAMYYSGAEISRVEDSLHRLAKAYGAKYVNIYAITSSIVITIEFPSFPAVTMSRRMRRSSIYLGRLERLNELCRKYVSAPDAVEKLQEDFNAAISKKPSKKVFLLGEMGAGIAFAFFFGGNIFDALAAGAIALIIFLMQNYVRPICNGQVFFNLVASFVTGTLACILGNHISLLTVDKIMIADIMLLIPGIAITNSIQYTISGDSISGFEKLIDSVLQGLGIAAGFALSMYIFL